MEIDSDRQHGVRGGRSACAVGKPNSDYERRAAAKHKRHECEFVVANAQHRKRKRLVTAAGHIAAEVVDAVRRVDAYRRGRVAGVSTCWDTNCCAFSSSTCDTTAAFPHTLGAAARPSRPARARGAACR